MGGDLPETYLVIKRPDAIRLLHVLVYSDAQAPPPAAAAGSWWRRVNWCTVLVVLYAAAMVVQWAVHDRRVRVALKQYWRWWHGQGGLAQAPYSWR